MIANPLFNFSLQQALSPLVFSALIISLTLVLPSLIYAKSMLRPPLWYYVKPEEKIAGLEKITVVQEKWKKFNTVSLIAGIIVGLAAFFAFQNSVSPYLAPVMSILVYITGISFLTDFNVRLVDRWILRMGIWFTSALAYIELSSRANLLEFGAFIAIVFVLSMFFFIPGVGASDSRTFVLITTSIFPYFGGMGVILATIGMVLFVMGYSFKRHGFNMGALLTKYSNPLVPMTLTPALIVLLAGGAISLI